MMDRYWFWLFWLLPFSAMAQDYTGKYEELMMGGQLDKIPGLLQLWEQETPEDENLYATGFNHYLAISRQQRTIRPTQLDSTAQEGGSFVSAEVFFNDSLFGISQQYMQKAIALKPRRLDFHFGKIHALWLKGDHRRQTSEILGLLDLGDLLGQQWQWAGEEPLENAAQFFKSTLYQYIADLYGAGKVDYVLQISERMLESFPKDVPSLSNSGLAYLTKGNYKKACKYFKKAHRIAPKDVIVLNNLGDTHDYMDKPRKAIEYYERIIEYGDERQRKFAAEKIHDLKLRMNGSQ